MSYIVRHSECCTEVPAQLVARAGSAEAPRVGPAAQVAADEHGRVAPLNGEADREDEVPLPVRAAPRGVGEGVATTRLNLRDLVDEAPRLRAEGAVGLGDEALVVQRELLLLDGVEVTVLATRLGAAVRVGRNALLLPRLFCFVSVDGRIYAAKIR